MDRWLSRIALSVVRSFVMSSYQPPQLIRNYSKMLRDEVRLDFYIHGFVHLNLLTEAANQAKK